ncbi:olfactory receptor 14A16-like [Passerculus sandwichensis]
MPQVIKAEMPPTRQGMHYVLTMVEATTGWLETYPVPHTTARNTILGLEKQILWRHDAAGGALAGTGASTACKPSVDWDETSAGPPAPNMGEEGDAIRGGTRGATSLQSSTRETGTAPMSVHPEPQDSTVGTAPAEWNCTDSEMGKATLPTNEPNSKAVGPAPAVLRGNIVETPQFGQRVVTESDSIRDTRQLQLLHFCLLLGISLAALLGNGLIISAVACSHHLHTPMFFFLLNLALSDLGSICTTVPKAMHNSLWDTRTISYTGCAAQLFFFMFFISAELSLLTIMCYDRYVSICKSLHYGTLLDSRACAHMAAAAWACGFLYSLLHTANAFSLPLCHGNDLGQFFCEIPQILKLSCSQSNLRELGLIVVSLCLSFGCFVFIVFSYVQIFRAVLRIPSEQGQHKAFSTCLPHLAVVSLFISTGTFAHLKPPSISSPSLDISVSVLYSVVPPALNPLIYSLRNQELKAAVQTMMTGCFQKR